MRVTSEKSRVQEKPQAPICEGEVEWPSYSSGTRSRIAFPLKLELLSVTHGPQTPDEGFSAKRTMIGSAWMIGWRLASRGLGMASTLLLARILAPADFGLVAMATTFSASIEALSQIGVLDALVRHERKDRSLYDTAFTLNVIRGLATALIIAGAAPLVAEFFGEPRLALVLLVLALNFAAQGCENVGPVEFRRKLAFASQFRLMLIPRLLQIVVTVTLALLQGSYWALVAGIVAGRMASLAASYALHPYRPRASLVAWRSLAAFSAWSWAAALVRLAWNRMDAFVIGANLGSARLARISSAATWLCCPRRNCSPRYQKFCFPALPRPASRTRKP